MWFEHVLLIGAGCVIYWMSKDFWFAAFWLLMMMLSSVLHERFGPWPSLAACVCLAVLYFGVFKRSGEPKQEDA